MSRKHKNNHYHYAEQYTDGSYRRRVRASGVLRLPRRAVFFAMLVLIMLGVVTATFSADIGSDASDSAGSILVRVRNTKLAQDYVADGMDRKEAYAMTGADADLSSVGGFTDLHYIGTKNGWATNSAPACNSSGWIPISFTSASNETFKIWHGNNWSDAYFSVTSGGAISLNTQYTLTTNGSNPNMTYSFAAGNYGIKIANPDTWNNMQMTLYRLFDANSVFYIDVSDYWADNDPEIGGYFCDSTSNTAVWVRATRCGDISNTHLYKLVAPNSAIYSKLVLGRFQKGTTAAQMSFSGSRFYNQSVDILYQASNTKIKLTSYGSGSGTPANVSYTASYSHTHRYYAYEYTRNTSSDSYALARTISSGTNVECTDGTISLSASDRSSSGYDFDGWYRGTTSGVNNATTLVSSSRSCTPTNYSGNSYYYAKYTLSTNTITYKSDATPATAAASTITNPTGASAVPASETKVYGSTYTITSNTFSRSGYTQVGWSTSVNDTTPDYDNDPSTPLIGNTYSANADLTLYPVWRLKTPANTDPASYAAADPSDPNPNQPKLTNANTVVGTKVNLLSILDIVNYSNSDVVRTYSPSITTDDGMTNAADASVGTDPAVPADYMKFDATVPGTYKVTLTVTDTSQTNVTNASNATSATTNTCTITVLPDTPVFTLDIEGEVDESAYGIDGSTEAKAYKIIIGSRYYFTVDVDSGYLTSHPVANYTYTWSTDADFAVGHVITAFDGLTNFKFDKDFNVITVPADPDERTLADEPANKYIKLYCRVERNGTHKDSDMGELYCFVQPLVEEFEYEPLQKIYNLTDHTVTLAARYNSVAGSETFDNLLKFSNDNNTYVTAIDNTGSGFITSFIGRLNAYLYSQGPKYFYIDISGTNSSGESFSAPSNTIHTQVHTFESSATRTLYFENSTGDALNNYLVMCYYTDSSGTVHYQAAQDLKKGDPSNAGLHYRVMIPSTAQKVCFGFIATARNGKKYYGKPTWNGSSFTFTSPIFMGYTAHYDLAANPSIRKITANSRAFSDPFYTYACTAGAY